jgi:hypothetical protein
MPIFGLCEEARLHGVHKGVDRLIGHDEATTMKKLIITVAHGNASPTTALELGFLLSEEAELAEYLERLREALFLTGAALQSAKVVNDDYRTEWFASPDFVRRLNGARFQH